MKRRTEVQPIVDVPILLELESPVGTESQSQHNGIDIEYRFEVVFEHQPALIYLNESGRDAIRRLQPKSGDLIELLKQKQRGGGYVYSAALIHRTLDNAAYGELLRKVLPCPIRNDQELEAFTQTLLVLEENEHPSHEEDTLAELLALLIEQYEERRYPIPNATVPEKIRLLLEQRSLSEKDLWPILGSKEITSKILNGKRGVNVAIASKLAAFFHVDASLFVELKASGRSAESRE